MANCMAQLYQDKIHLLHKKNMKKQFGLLVLILGLICFGCDKEASNLDKNISLTTVSFSVCTADTKSSTSSIPSITINGQIDDKLLININNTEFCCGTDSISINKSITDNKLTLEIIDKGPFTYCYCPHDVEFSIGPFKNDNYTLTFIESKDAYKRDTFVINFTYSQHLDTTITSKIIELNE
jgi:hypothetical protein